MAYRWRALFMQRRQIPRLLCICLVLTSSLAALPQGQPTVSIIGITRVLRGTFPEPVMVNLQLHGANIASAYTDPEGRFSFNNLPGNSYRVVIADDQYTPVSIDVNVRPDLMAMNILQLTLVPKVDKGRTASGPYVVGAADMSRNHPKKAIKEYERGVEMEAKGKTEE